MKKKKQKFRKIIKLLFLFLATLFVSLQIFAQNTVTGKVSSVEAKIADIKPRNASGIQASNWNIGAETMDRDYTIYENWKEYLAPLGIKKARLQSGWARTEIKPGVYNFA